LLAPGWRSPLKRLISQKKTALDFVSLGFDFVAPGFDFVALDLEKIARGLDFGPSFRPRR
jgi:hypothetical protein